MVKHHNEAASVCKSACLQCARVKIMWGTYKTPTRCVYHGHDSDYKVRSVLPMLLATRLVHLRQAFVLAGPASQLAAATYCTVLFWPVIALCLDCISS